MKNALKIFGFTIAVVAFYGYVGHMVPQKITYPPETLTIRADLSTEEMIEIGKEIAESKGTCMTCHTIGQEGGALRFPDLGGIGSRAGSRKEGVSDIEYLAESLYEPNTYIVDGFQPGMPAISRPPIGLNDQEILTVIAYLQSLGGTPTITMDTKLKWQGEAPAAPAAAAPVPDGSQPLDGPTLMTTYFCTTCHNLETPDRLVGPSLFDVGRRLGTAQIYEAIMEPDAVIAEGFTGGIMPATLQAGGFYDKITTQQLKAMVNYLASQQGN